MKKNVYCLIHLRRKCIKYVAKDNVSELKIIRESLTAACKTDAVLSAMMKGKMIILQKVDPNRENEWIDIEEDDDKSKIKVLLISMPDISSSLPLSTSFDPDNLHKGESLEMDVKVFIRRVCEC